MLLRGSLRGCYAETGPVESVSLTGTSCLQWRFIVECTKTRFRPLGSLQRSLRSQLDLATGGNDGRKGEDRGGEKGRRGKREGKGERFS